MSANTKQIRFHLGEETRHVIETINDESLENSLFSEQYKKVLSSLDKLFSMSDSSTEPDVDNTLNNIISFIGDRGSGKTSCMMSLAKLLKNGLSDKMKDKYRNIAGRSYHHMDRIDPSFFDKSHNVIELFLAGLYNDFCKMRDINYTSSNAQKEAQERHVLELFSQAQTMMFEMTKSESDHYDALDNLQNLSAGVRLWSVIGQLVTAFFSYFDKENGVLILPIDDIDLNSSMAAGMMEQIRKFLIHNNIIILFAVKIDQLELSKRRSLVEEYETMFKHKLLKDDSVINEMSEAYLTKLLPHQQRIYMPDGSAYFNSRVTVVAADGRTEVFTSVRQMIPELIYRKTRYLFYNSPDKTSYIVPTNLRELRLLVSLLYGMNDAIYGKSNAYNKLLLRKYLYENWITNNLDADMQVSVREILATQDNAQVNARVLTAIRQHFFNNENSFLKFTESHSEAKLIFDRNNINYNIAVGDVLDITDILEESEQNTPKLKLLFIIRSFYSMRLYETYDSLTDEKTGSDGEVISPTRLSDKNLSEYDKLVAGYYINARLSRIIPPGRAQMETRDERRINFEELLKLIDKVIAENGQITEHLRLVEFFLLGISRRYNTQHENIDEQYRKAFPVFYAEPLKLIKKNAYFDIGALLYNLTRIESCYKRFNHGDRIYELAENNPASLLNSFRMYAIQNKAEDDVPRELASFKERYWQSCCCFRNAEVIKAFRAHVERIESDDSSHMSVMAAAFNHMSKFRLYTYDKQGDNYCEIKFGYLKDIGNLLGTAKIEKDFMNVFDKDYRPEPESINIPHFIRGTQQAQKNRTSTQIFKIYKNYPTIAQHYKDIVNTAFRIFGSHMSRDEILRAITILNTELNKYRKK